MSEDRPVVAWLVAERASHDLVSYARASGLDWPELYERCPRADFLLAIAIRCGVSSELLEEIAIALAIRAIADLDVETLDEARIELETRSTNRIELARELELRADAATELPVALGLRALSIAANASQDREAVAALPGLAIELALSTVLDCAMMSVVAAMHDELANLVRSKLPSLSIPKAW